MLEKAKSYDTQLQFVKIFIIMDTSSIKFLATNDETSKFQEIPMKNIIKIGKKFTKSFCFEILFHQNTTSNDFFPTNFQRGSMTLCGCDLKTMKNWVSGILKMKSCEHQINTVADFQVINGILNLG